MSGTETAQEGGAGALLLSQPIVIDNGTGSIKAGFAGSSKPKVVLSTKVGRAKHMRIMPGGALEEQQSSKGAGGPGSAPATGGTATAGAPTGTSQGSGTAGATAGSTPSKAASRVSNTTTTAPSAAHLYNHEYAYYVGRKLDEHRGAFYLEYPMEHGCVLDNGWDAMERLWDSVLYQSLNVKQTEDHPVLLTEPPLNPSHHRNTTAEIFFETYRTPALYFSAPAVLSLYASGRMTGIVLDVGDGTTHAVPVYEGFALPHSVTRTNVAGRDVTRQLQLHLRRAGLPLTTTAEFDLTQRIKEDVCYLLPNPQQQQYTDELVAAYNNSTSTSSAMPGTVSSSAANASTAMSSANDPMSGVAAANKTKYQLPDGQVLALSSERYQPPAVLFDPVLMGSEEAGVADVLVHSILKSDLELRSQLYSQIVLAGGSTLLPGFGERLLYEVRARSPASVSLRISAPPARLFTCYVGGSILASLATFKHMWVSRQDYEENGYASVHRREL